MLNLIALLFAFIMQTGDALQPHVDNPCALNPVRTSTCLPQLFPVGTVVVFTAPIYGYNGGVVTGYYLEPATQRWVYVIRLPDPFPHEHFTPQPDVRPS